MLDYSIKAIISGKPKLVPAVNQTIKAIRYSSYKYFAYIYNIYYYFYKLYLVGYTI
jgi:hypothetical protein